MSRDTPHSPQAQVNDTSTKIYSSEISVRGYELDSFGHVNHAVYISYLEHARWELLNQAGVTLSVLESLQRWPVIAELNLKYLKPTYMGDRLRVDSSLMESSRSSYRIEHKIFKLGSGTETVSPPLLVAAGSVLVVTVNEKGRPDETPREVSRIWAG